MKMMEGITQRVKGLTEREEWPGWARIMLNRHAMPNNDKKPFLFQMQQLYGTPTLQPYILSLLFSSPSARDKWRENNKLQALVLPPLFRVANAFAHSRDYTCFRLVSFLPYRPRISKIQFKGRYFMLRVRDKSVSHTLHTNFAGYLFAPLFCFPLLLHHSFSTLMCWTNLLWPKTNIGILREIVLGWHGVHSTLSQLNAPLDLFISFQNGQLWLGPWARLGAFFFLSYSFFL